MTLDDVKIEQLSGVGTKRIHGSLVERSPNFDAARASSKWVAIRPCLCVWDSPESPCRCPSSLLYWVLEEDIKKSEQLDTKSHAGENILAFDIDKKAQIGVELLRGRPITSIAADQTEVLHKLRRLSANIRRLKEARNQAVGCAATAGTAPGVIALSWDDLAEAAWAVLEDLGSIRDAGEASGIDWEVVVGLVIIFL